MRRERDGIIAEDLHQCKVIFGSDVFVDVAIVERKLGSFSNDDGNGNENVISKHKFSLL